MRLYFNAVAVKVVTKPEISSLCFCLVALSKDWNVINIITTTFAYVAVVQLCRVFHLIVVYIFYWGNNGLLRIENYFTRGNGMLICCNCHYILWDCRINPSMQFSRLNFVLVVLEGSVCFYKYLLIFFISPLTAYAASSHIIKEEIRYMYNSFPLRYYIITVDRW